jgi:hypothetical protein
MLAVMGWLVYYEDRPDCGPRLMLRIAQLNLILIMSIFASLAPAQEHGRIKRKPPSLVEAERIASDMALNDSLLRRGDIVVTNRGFFVFRGLAADGVSNEFALVPNPLASRK